LIAELGQQELSNEQWGFKASRLSRVAKLGFTVPPGICLSARAFESPSAAEALSAWLDTYRPERVVLRTSSAQEDTFTAANAGRTMSILGCPPDLHTVLQRVRNEILLAVEEHALGASVIVQQQVSSGFGGVAFCSERGVVAECSRGTPSAVTSGATPEMRIDVTGSSATASGPLAPTFAIAAVLVPACTRLRRSFGFSVDVEWVWYANALFILQVRPITTPVEAVL
jgi:hypothetical protein